MHWHRNSKFDGMIGPNGEEVFEAYAENNTPGAYRIFWELIVSSGSTDLARM